MSSIFRALLVRAEQNLYGRLTLEEFFILAREVELYTQGGIITMITERTEIWKNICVE